MSIILTKLRESDAPAAIFVSFECRSKTTNDVSFRGVGGGSGSGVQEDNGQRPPNQSKRF